MEAQGASRAERRSEPRVVHPGAVRLVAPTPSAVVEGRLVDVSARGLRVTWAEALPAQGDLLALEVRLEDPDRPEGPPRLVLDGRGRVVWARGGARRRAEVGLHLDAPLVVRRPFPEVQIF
jgi:PilZ domain